MLRRGGNEIFDVMVTKTIFPCSMLNTRAIKSYFTNARINKLCINAY